MWLIPPVLRGRALSHPVTETLSVAGYGSDPRACRQWQQQLVPEAIRTAVWAHQVGDADFEAQGRRMIARALAKEGTDA